MTLNETTDLPLPSLRALIDRHGSLAVGLAYLRAALGRKARPPDARAALLSDHMRRDIGLPPMAPLRRPERRGWDI